MKRVCPIASYLLLAGCIAGFAGGFGASADGRAFDLDGDGSVELIGVSSRSSLGSGESATSSDQLVRENLSVAPRWEEPGQLLSVAVRNEHIYSTKNRSIRRISEVSATGEQQFSRGQVSAAVRGSEREVRGRVPLLEANSLLETQRADSRLIVTGADVYSSLALSPIWNAIAGFGLGEARGDSRSDYGYGKIGAERELASGSLQVVTLGERTRIYGSSLENLVTSNSSEARGTVFIERLGGEAAWVRRMAPNWSLRTSAEGGVRRIRVEDSLVEVPTELSRYGGGGLALRYTGATTSSNVIVRRLQERLALSLDPVTRDTFSIDHRMAFPGKRDLIASLLWIEDETFGRGDPHPKRSVFESSIQGRQGFGRWLDRRNPVTQWGVELTGTMQLVRSRPENDEFSQYVITLGATGAI